MFELKALTEEIEKARRALRVVSGEPMSEEDSLHGKSEP
jgi:hypothetical protein